MAQNETSVWPKWKIALAVGAPVALGIAGYMYYRSRRAKAIPKSKKGTVKSTKDPEKAAKPESSPEKELSTLEKAQASKNKGNKYFKGGKFEQAIACYTEAIDVCPSEQKKEIATFYQNRAAAFEQLKNYEQLIADCTKALEYNPQYVKALFRKAKACETTGDLTQCLEDVTAVCILEGFQNPTSLQMADRVLKELGKTKAHEAFQKREPVLQSSHFIESYFSAFTNDPLTWPLLQSVEVVTNNSDENEKNENETPEKEIKLLNEEGKNEDQHTSPYIKAKKYVENKQYSDVIDLCTEEINGGDSPHMSLALLMRATFFLLKGQGNDAMTDFNKLLALEAVDKTILSNALIKRGSLQVQEGKQKEALEDFVTAIQTDPDNCDIYHHRGQLNLLLGQTEDAIKDFEKCLSLNPTFSIASAQKCYTEYRYAFEQKSPLQLQNAIKAFENHLQKHPNCAEGFALYGQALADQQQFDKADENFKAAAKLEPLNANIYVHRGLLCLQWKQNIDEASRLIKKAIEIDDKCEFAYETLGTVEVQRGNLPLSIELFNKAINLAKTEIEMSHLYSLLDAAIAQSKIAKRLGINLPMGM